MLYVKCRTQCVQKYLGLNVSGGIIKQGHKGCYLILILERNAVDCPRTQNCQNKEILQVMIYSNIYIMIDIMFEVLNPKIFYANVVTLLS